MLYVLLADGFEETEMIAPLDILRRAGIPVQTVGITGKAVTGAHGITVMADLLPDQVDKLSIKGVILPGGMPGTTNLQADSFVEELILSCAKEKKLVAAICAAPMIFGELGLLAGKEATCFPGFEEHLKGAVVTSAPVAVDGNIITGKGAGSALEFGAALVNFCTKEGKGEEILAQMQTPSYV